MRTFILSNPQIAEVMVMSVFVCGRLLMSADVTELEEMLRDAVLAAFNDAHLELKEAAAFMGIDKEQLRRQLDPAVPNQYLSILRLLSLPFGFWMSFGPRLIQIVYRRRMAQIKENIAEMLTPEQRKAMHERERVA